MEVAQVSPDLWQAVTFVKYSQAKRWDSNSTSQDSKELTDHLHETGTSPSALLWSRNEETYLSEPECGSSHKLLQPHCDLWEPQLESAHLDALCHQHQVVPSRYDLVINGLIHNGMFLLVNELQQGSPK
jgi:hypothetical protein